MFQQTGKITMVKSSQILRSLFESNPDVGYDEANTAVMSAGLATLNLNTFRTMKSMWRKACRSNPVVTAPVHDAELHNDEDYFVPPVVDETHVLNDQLKTLFEAIHKASVLRPQNVRLTGPAGCGKTTTAMEFAARYQRPMLVMDCALVREPRDWFGYRQIDRSKGTTYWHHSLFSKFIQRPNAVIVLDEINRVSQNVINSLLPLLDDRRRTYSEEAGTLKVAPGVVFFGTTNVGREFSGTFAFDFAQSDRLCTLIETNYLPEAEEAKLLNKRTGLALSECHKLTAVATHVRRKASDGSADSLSRTISTRMLLNAAEKMHLAGATTLRYTLLSHFSDSGNEQSERGQVLKLLQGKFGPLF